MPNDFDPIFDDEVRQEELIARKEAEAAVNADRVARVGVPFGQESQAPQAAGVPFGAEPTPAPAPEQPSEAPDQAGDQAGPKGGTFTRGQQGSKQGLALGGGRILDSMLLGIQEIITAGAPEGKFDIFPEEGIFEPAIQSTIPERHPEDTAGAVGESIGRGVAGMVGAGKAFQAAGMAGRFTKSILAPAVGAGFAYGEEDDTASTYLVEQGGIADNPLTRALATNPGDARFERGVKVAVEDATIGLAFEAIVKSKRIFTGAKSAVDVGDPIDVLEATESASAAVIAARAQVDRVIEGAETLAKTTEADAADEMLRLATRAEGGLDAAATAHNPILKAGLRAAIKHGDEVIPAPEAGGLHFTAYEALAERMGVAADEIPDEIVESLESGFLDLRGAVGEGGTIDPASFIDRDGAMNVARELTGAAPLPPGARAELDKLAEAGVEPALKEAEQMLGEAERRLLETVTNNGVDPRVVERVRQTLQEGAPERLKGQAAGVDRALGDYSTRAAKARTLAGVVDRGPRAAGTATKSVFNNQLEVTTEQAAAMHSAIQEGTFRGSVEGASNVLAETLDSTNFDRIAESGDVKELIAGMAKMFGDQLNSLRQTNPEAHAATVEKASEFLKEDLRHFAVGEGNLVGVIDSLIGGTDDLAAKMLTLRTFETALAKKVSALADPGRIKTDVMHAAEFLRYQTLLANVTDARAGVASQIGRGLQAQRIAASSRGFDQLLKLDDVAIDAATDMVNNAGGADRLAGLAAKFAHQGVDLNTARRVAQQTDSRGRILGDMLFENFITSILSGPRTHLVNLGGNAAAAGWLANDALVETALVAAHKGDPRYMRAALSYGHGLLAGMKAAVKGVDGMPSPLAKAWATGEGTFGKAKFVEHRAGGDKGFSISAGKVEKLGSLQGGATKAVIDKALGAKGGLGGRLVDGYGRLNAWSLRALAAGDEIAKSINYHGALYKDAFEKAWDDVIETGADNTADIQQVIARQKELIEDAANTTNLARAAQANPTDFATRARLDRAVSMQRGAEDLAKLGTFTREPPGYVKWLNQGRGRYPILRFAMPFVTTPANILSFATYDRGPLGLLSKRFRDEIKQGGIARRKALARHATGSAIAISAAGLAYGGYLTGSGPTERSARESWLADPRNVPYSVRLPDGKGGVVPLRFGRGDPVALVPMMVADAAEAMGALEDGQESNPITGIMVGMAEAMRDKSYLTGVSDLLRMVENPDRYGQQYFVRFASNMVPQSAMMRQVPQMVDEFLPEIPEDSEILGTVAELFGADGGNSLPILERNQGFFIELADNVTSNMPPILGNPLRAAHNAVFESRLSAERVPMVDMWAEPIQYMPQVFRDPGEADPVREEAARVGAFVNPRSSFGKITKNGQTIKLSPEQQHDWAVFSADPPTRRMTMREAMAKKMYGTKDPKPGQEFSKRWEMKTDEDREAKLATVREGYRQSGRKALFKKYPDLAAQLKALGDERRQERREKRKQVSEAQEASAALGNNDLGGAMKGLPSMLRVLRDQNQGQNQ
jgi:uncharacterized protein YfcZ (UPF0381/DUF406 family)